MRRVVWILLLAGFSLAESSLAEARERVVMPFDCGLESGRIKLSPAIPKSYPIIGTREQEALTADFTPATTQAVADDHKAYYPGAHPITIRITGDTTTGRLLGAQLIGRRGSEIAKRVDIFATALFHDMNVAAVSDLDLSYTPPLGSPWDAIQTATQAWTRQHQHAHSRHSPT